MPETQDMALASLHDIHLPSALGIWPLAPGWYVLMLLLAGLGVFGIMRLFVSRPKRIALRSLMAYQTQLSDPVACCANVAVLLKRVALVYYPRVSVACLHGDAWIDFLNHTGKGVDFCLVRTALLVRPYQSSVHDMEQAMVDAQALLKVARQWVQQRGKPCLN